MPMKYFNKCQQLRANMWRNGGVTWLHAIDEDMYFGPQYQNIGNEQNRGTLISEPLTHQGLDYYEEHSELIQSSDDQTLVQTNDQTFVQTITQPNVRTFECTRDGMCVVCFEQAVSVTFSCGHLCCCSGCSHAIKGTSNKCPLCRSTLTE